MVAIHVQRIARHLVCSPRTVSRAFPRATLLAIEQAIRASESAHSGEIRFAVEPALELGPLWQGQSARERAIEVFSELRVWDTEQRNGVLIYLLLADRDVELVADRCIDARVGQPAWQAICQAMELAFRRGDYQAGVLLGIRAVTQQLIQHYPSDADARNQLLDAPVLL